MGTDSCGGAVSRPAEGTMLGTSGNNGADGKRGARAQRSPPPSPAAPAEAAALRQQESRRAGQWTRPHPARACSRPAAGLQSQMGGVKGRGHIPAAPPPKETAVLWVGGSQGAGDGNSER